MTGDDLPQGPHQVCPRCGAAAADRAFCAQCGLNLTRQGELPTADEYAAGVREQRWLEQQQREHEAETQARAERAAAERAEREAAARAADQRSRDPGRDRERDGGGAVSRNASRARRQRRLPLGLAVVVTLAAVGVVAALLIPGSDQRNADSSRTAEPTATPRTTNAPCGDITRGEGFFVGDIVATGISCDEARLVVAGFHRMDPGTAEPAEDMPVTHNFDDDGSTESVTYEYEGRQRRLSYSHSASGYETGNNRLSGGPVSITWESGA